MKSILLIAFVVPALALVTEYHSTPAQTPSIIVEQPVPEHEIPLVYEPKEMYMIEHYKYPESHIVVTVNQFPFDIGGNRPYEISVQGVQYRFKPEDVKDFLKKGESLNTEARQLPTGLYAKDPFLFPPNQQPQL